MKTKSVFFALALLSSAAINVSAATRYVDLNCASPAPPYSDWSSAATNIQDAVDAADPGDLILVTNGVYLTGGRIARGGMTNRVAVTKPVVLQSVNGPAVTVIQGYKLPPSATNSSCSVRCVYLTNNATLAGFTLTNGGNWGTSPYSSDMSGGGAWCEPNAMLSNCVIIACTAKVSGGGIYQGNCFNCSILTNLVAYYGGGAFGSTLSNCTLSGNLQGYTSLGGGGGAYSCTINDCTLTGNVSSAKSNGEGGGAACSSTLNHCTLSGNTSGSSGGGASSSTLNHCTVSSNSASSWGGGTFKSALTNCTLAGNHALSYGGGARLGTLNQCMLYNNTGFLGGGASESALTQCTLYGNSALNGGGASLGTLVNCCVVSNTASSVGGGVYAASATNCTLVGNSGGTGGGSYGSTLDSCIACYNLAAGGSNYDATSVLNYCCATPLATNGVGNIAVPPLFADIEGGDLHLQADSPCINAGNNAGATSTKDLDGNPRFVGGAVDMGAYECQSPALLGCFIWLQSYGLPADASTVYSDLDGDRMNNWQEWRANTVPTNAASVLQMLVPTNSVGGLAVSWQSIGGASYFLERSTNLLLQPAFSCMASNLFGQAGVTTYTDTSAVGSSPFFYRVGVQ